MKRILTIICSLLWVGGMHAQEIRAVKATELEKIISETDRPLVINMWATWCVPCIEEIPYFLQEIKKHNEGAGTAADSIRLILVSLDGKENFPKQLKSFVQKRNFSTEILWLDETNADYFCPKLDPKWSGVIPATLFVNPKKGYRNFVEEQLSQEALKRELMAILK
ncbi:MAG TPA: TlpA disulfide reductase family protein [Chitinophagaceae bacterium]|nr:TlpA disulfide reductase family protein [Chitinophagaceae bacterium]